MVSSTPQPHFTLGKDPVPILQEAGWAPGPVWTGGKSRPHRDSIPNRPAPSHSLYHLSYRSTNCGIPRINYNTIYSINFIIYRDKGKGKIHPRTGHEGPAGEQMYSSTVSLTSVLDGMGG